MGATSSSVHQGLFSVRPSTPSNLSVHLCALMRVQQPPPRPAPTPASLGCSDTLLSGMPGKERVTTSTSFHKRRKLQGGSQGERALSFDVVSGAGGAVASVQDRRVRNSPRLSDLFFLGSLGYPAAHTWPGLDRAPPSPWLGDFCLLVWICGDSKEQKLFRAPAWPALFPALLPPPPVACACPSSLHSCLCQRLPPPPPHKRAAAESTLRRKLLVGRNFKRPKTKMGEGLEKMIWSGGGGGGTCRPAGRRLAEGGKMVALPTRSWGLGRGWGRAAGSFAVNLNACSSCGASSQGTAFCLLGAGCRLFSSPGLMPPRLPHGHSLVSCSA